MDFARYHETEALLRDRDEDPAREDVKRLGERVGGNGCYRISYLRSLAMLSRRESDQMAIECLREARALAEEIGLPGELWQRYGRRRGSCTSSAENGKEHATHFPGRPGSWRRSPERSKTRP